MKALSWMIGLLVVGSCGPTMAKREAQLAEYRRMLDRVHADREFVARASGEPKLLIGLSREKIGDVLGQPVGCENFNGRGAISPCRSLDDWDYWFYDLHDPEEPDVPMFGGGLELRLRFDAAGICRAARWAHSE
jgi:hypothetical protein